MCRIVKILKLVCCFLDRLTLCRGQREALLLGQPDNNLMLKNVCCFAGDVFPCYFQDDCKIRASGISQSTRPRGRSVPGVPSGRCGRRRRTRAGVSSAPCPRALPVRGAALPPAHGEGRWVFLPHRLCQTLQPSVCGAGRVAVPPGDGLVVPLSICRCSLWLRPPAVTSVVLPP